jgi:hypothetical protein
MAPKFGSVVDLTQSLGSPLSDAQIQLVQKSLFLTIVGFFFVFLLIDGPSFIDGS